MEDYIFIENRKDIAPKLCIHFTMSVLIFAVGVAFIYATVLSFTGYNLQEKLLMSFIAISLFGLFYYSLIITIWLFKKIITPDKIIVSEKGIYVSYLKKFISWGTITKIKMVGIGTMNYGHRPVVAAFLTDKKEALSKVPFFIKYNISLHENGIILYLTNINYNEKKCMEMISTLNKYRKEFGIDTESETPSLGIIDFYTKKKENLNAIISKNNRIRMTANWDAKTRELALKEDFQPPILLQEKSTLNKLLIPLFIQAIEKLILILKINNCFNKLNLPVFTDLDNIYIGEEKIALSDIYNAKSTEFFQGLYLNEFETNTKIYHFIGLNASYIFPKFNN